jgi:chaperonin cofactor prefoldin
MTSEEAGGKSDSLKDLKDEIPSWRRIGEFVRNVLRLERSVEALKKENGELNQRVGALQRQVDGHAGQLKVLVDFVNKALDERIESRAEEASIRAFERMASVAGLKTGKRARRKDKSR